MSDIEHTLAKDIMLPSNAYPIIYEDETIKRALAKFQFSLSSPNNKRRNLLVLDREDKPIGWITTRDILALLSPDYKIPKNDLNFNLSHLTGPTAFFARELMHWVSDDIKVPAEESLDNLGNEKITEFIRPFESGAVHASAPLKAVANLMYENNLSTLPVVENGKMVGFIRAEDIVLEVARIAMATKSTSKTALKEINLPSF